MIQEADVDFHPTAPDEPEWAEAFSADFSVPEQDINVRVYLLFRPQYGVVQTSVSITSRDALQPWHADYADFRPHVPCPPSLRQYTLANGLSFETLAPHQTWRLSFDDGEDTSFDVQFDALMKPYSPFDPDDNPRAGDQPPLVNHFEQSGRYIGWVKLRGQKSVVDSVSMMNHGWGLRRDRRQHGPTGSRGMTWLHAHFPSGEAIYGSWYFDLASPERLSLAYGYVLTQGKASGLIEGEGTVLHDADGYPIDVKVFVRDKIGNEHRLRSRAIHRSIWASWPNMTTFCVFAQWTGSDGLRGYGEIMEFTEIASLTQLRSRKSERQLLS
jgi:hypothetical protein